MKTICQLVRRALSRTKTTSQVRQPLDQGHSSSCKRAASAHESYNADGIHLRISRSREKKRVLSEHREAEDSADLLLSIMAGCSIPSAMLSHTSQTTAGHKQTATSTLSHQAGPRTPFFLSSECYKLWICTLSYTNPTYR